MSLSAGVPKRRLERLEGGFGVFACRVRGAKKAFGRFGGFEAWQTAGLNAKKKLLMWPWCLCLCLRGWGCKKGVWSVWRVALLSLPAGLGAKCGALVPLPAESQEKTIDGALVPLPAGLGMPKRHLEGLERFRPGKQQA